MVRSVSIVLIVIFLLSSNVFAGLGSFYSYQYSRETGTVVAAITIKEKGIYNLVISVQFLKKPYDKKIYKSDAYEHLIDMLLVKWRGLAIQKILEAKEVDVADLAELKKSVEKEIEKLINQMKKKFFPEHKLEVVFSLSNFFLLEPEDK